MKNICKKIYFFFVHIHSFFWCFFNGVKYKKGVFIGRHVIKKRKIKLILSEYSRIAFNTLLWGDGTIKIGKHSSVGSCSRIFSSKNGGVVIGDYTMSASHLYIIDCDHGTNANQLIQKQSMIQKKVIIGNDVWLGYHSTILKGVELKNGVVVGACSLVTKSFEENSIIGGVPAKVLKTRK